MTPEPLRILIIGAHPDDADIKAGGSAAKWRALGHVVKLVSLTDGRAGHQSEHGSKVARRRKAEAQASAATIGATYDVLDISDGELDDRLEYCHLVIRLIRTFRPDLVITHRSTDYHRDHRFAGLVVQDAAYLLTVPAICPDVPHLTHVPVILYFSDAYKRPCRFEPHVVVDIEDNLDSLVAMLHCHASQFYEWLPFNAGYLDQVPADDDSRRQWLRQRVARRIEPLAKRYRDLVVATYGAKRGEEVRYIEAFEISEFGTALDKRNRARLFPFLPSLPDADSASVGREWVDIPENDD